MTTLTNRAARGAIGIAFLLACIALAFTWAAYRLASWPLRRLARDDPAAAKRQAMFQLVGAIAVLAGTLRAMPREPGPDATGPEPERGNDE